jgi:hypothetical protein
MSASGERTLPTPVPSINPGYDYPCNQFLRCRLWTEGSRQAGGYRASRCAACHVLCADNGLSQTADRAVSKDELAHSSKHELTTRVPSQQCVLRPNRR